jgi:hypothetical protein
MGKAIMRLDKIKTAGAATRVYEHNYRTANVSHADKDKTDDNEELVSLDGMTLNEKLKERLEQLKDTNKKVRKNAVLMIEVMTSIPVEDKDKIDVDKWKVSQVEWLKDTFNANPEKYGDNVISVVLHMDESSPHCHGVIIPIDDKGKLNASYYIDGKVKLSELQDSYSNKMNKEFGLERGIKGSFATHEDMKKFHAAVHEAATTEAPLPIKVNGRNETAEEYRERVAMPLIQEYKLRELDQNNKIKRLTNERNTIFANEKNDIYAEFDSIPEIKGLDTEDIKEILKQGVVMAKLNEGLQNYPDKEKALETFNNITLIIKFQEEELAKRLQEEEEDKKNKKKKKDEEK